MDETFVHGITCCIILKKDDNLHPQEMAYVLSIFL